MPIRRLPSIHAGGPGSTTGTGIYSSSASNFVFSIIGNSAIPATTFSVGAALCRLLACKFKPPFYHTVESCILWHSHSWLCSWVCDLTWPPNVMVLQQGCPSHAAKAVRARNRSFLQSRAHGRCRAEPLPLSRGHRETPLVISALPSLAPIPCQCKKQVNGPAICIRTALPGQIRKQIFQAPLELD